MQTEYKVINVNNNSSAAQFEKLLNAEWTVSNAYGTGDTLCIVLGKRRPLKTKK